MARASQNLEGLVYCRSQIHFGEIKDKFIEIPWDERFICIWKRKKFMWERLSALSASNYKKYKKHVFDREPAIQMLSRNFPVEISGAIGEFKENIDRVNGIYIPIPEVRRADEHNIYKKQGDNDLWLYPVFKDDGAKIQWWIGQRKNCFRNPRRAWGYAHSEKISPESLPPPSCLWWIFDGLDAQHLKWEQKTNIILTTLSTKTNNEKHLEVHLENSELKEAILRTQNEHLMNLVKSYYNKITPELRKTLFNDTLKNIFKKAEICSVCYSHKPLTKCLHFDCIGACQDCRKQAREGGGGDGSCCACGKQQKLECPICLDEHSEQYLKILECKHVVCWKCFCNSYEAKRPIKKCPKCRKSCIP